MVNRVARALAKQRPQNERLLYIDLRLRFLGNVRRQDVVARFGIQTAAATRDMAKYRDLVPGNLAYRATDKSYERTPAFEPMFPGVSAQEVLEFLSQRPGYGGSLEPEPLLPVEMPLVRSRVDTSVLAAVTSAIRSGSAIEIQYRSISSGLTPRVIVPHALANTGDRWHARAYDRRRNEFRDFVLGRIDRAEAIDAVITHEERASKDIQWNNIVQLELVPHPNNVANPETLQAEFSMDQGVLRVQVRAALVGYLLRSMSVDCSERHRIRGPSYQWWLKNRLALYGLSNLDLAPGYVDSKN